MTNGISAETVLTVYSAIQRQGPITQKALRESTGLPRRTLYTAISKLKEFGLIHASIKLGDTRQTNYTIVTKQSLTERINLDNWGVTHFQ